LADGADGEPLLYCFGGCTYEDLLAELIERTSLDDDACAALQSEIRTPLVPDARRIKQARQIYAHTDTGPQIPAYLASRSISIQPPAVLRRRLQCPHRLGIQPLAMVAPIVALNGEQTAIHMTYLSFDGRKIDLPKEFQRETRGVARGGSIRLAEHDPERELIVAEGLETALSVMELLGLPGWAAVYAANLKDTLQLPASVRRIIIAADNDKSGAGQRAALGAYRRWSAEGRTVQIIMPKHPGEDFNDVLRGQS
jgi:phage/plasmid primase-like uncharacterized protein